MRVIAGVAKGRRLTAPRGHRTRPTADRVKEALFSSLQTRLDGATVLDLYAGSGALGIEALSRGAAHATFVERARPALQAPERNLVAAGVSDRAEVVTGDAAAALRRTPPGGPYDLVLIDPPYATDSDALGDVLDHLVGHLAVDALVSVELDRRSAPPRWPPGLLGERSRVYGDTTLHLACHDPRTDGRPSSP